MYFNTELIEYHWQASDRLAFPPGPAQDQEKKRTTIIKKEMNTLERLWRHNCKDAFPALEKFGVLGIVGAVCLNSLCTGGNLGAGLAWNW